MNWWKTSRRPDFYRLMLVLCLASFDAAFANESSTKEPLFNIDEKETQLARKMAERENRSDDFDFSISAGYRVDQLHWSIAIDDISVASLVKWKELKIPLVKLSGRVALGEVWFTEGFYSSGSITSGSASDTDFGEDDLAFSDMRSKAGGSVSDVSLAIGREFEFSVNKDSRSLYLYPLLGVSYHQQKLTMYDGLQTYPIEADFVGLDNGYSAHWSGLWLGLGLKYFITPEIELAGAFQFHDVSYEARANWNLRSDLMHPLSFKHDANGIGSVFSLSARYYFSRNLYLGLHLDTQDWETKKGIDKTCFSNGIVERYALNSVEWKSKVLRLALGYQF